MLNGLDDNFHHPDQLSEWSDEAATTWDSSWPHTERHPQVPIAKAEERVQFYTHRSQAI